MPRQAARAQGNIGGCQFALHQYRPALQSFLEAHRQAEAANDHSAAAIFDVNIASLYSELGELDAASEWIQDTIHRLNAKDRQLPAADPHPIGHPARPPGPYAGSAAALLPGHRCRRPRGRPRSLRQRLEPPRRGIPQARRTRAGRTAPAGGIPRTQAQPSRVRRFLPQPGTFALGAGGSCVGRRVARSRRGTLRAASGLDSRPGTSIIIVDAYEWRRGGCRTRWRICASPSAWRAAGAGTHRPTMLRGWGPRDGSNWSIRRWWKPATGCIWRRHDAAADPRDLRGRRRESRRQPARCALAVIQARYFRITARLLGSPDSSAARRSAGATRARTRKAGKRSPASAPNWSGWKSLSAPPWRRRRPLCSTAPARRWMPTPRCSVFNWATASPGCGPSIATVSHSMPCRRAPRWNRRRGRPPAPSAAIPRRVADAPSQLSRTLFGQLPPRFQGKTRWLVALDRGSTLTDSQGRFTAGGLAFEAPLAALPDPNQPGNLSGRAARDRDDSRRSLVGGSRQPCPSSPRADLRRPGRRHLQHGGHQAAAPSAGPAVRVEARPDAAAAGGKRRGTRRLLAKLAAANESC